MDTVYFLFCFGETSPDLKVRCVWWRSGTLLKWKVEISKCGKPQNPVVLTQDSPWVFPLNPGNWLAAENDRGEGFQGSSWFGGDPVCSLRVRRPSLGTAGEKWRNSRVRWTALMEYETYMNMEVSSNGPQNGWFSNGTSQSKMDDD